ncbi:MAG: ABC transporter ATP-binding protein [Anaerolineae bacterium]|nr:ABC transporter ATP-binding protein [Anaerolineae bacterium]
MTIALQTTSVLKTYTVDNNIIRAVDNVSLGVEKGQFVALVGPSGSGKTTMLAMLAGLLSPTQGSIMIDGYELGRMKEKERAEFRRQKIGFTFQTNNLVPYLNVQENVELMLRLNNKYDRPGKEFAEELLVQLGLGDRLKNLPSQLSGGQQQRVAIARALIHNPDIVLADEPTANLDTERAYQVVETFASLIHSRNLAGIMVTHDLRMVEYTDKVIQMQDGKLNRVIDDKEEIRAFARSHLN